MEESAASLDISEPSENIKDEDIKDIKSENVIKEESLDIKLEDDKVQEEEGLIKTEEVEIATTSTEVMELIEIKIGESIIKFD